MVVLGCVELGDVEVDGSVGLVGETFLDDFLDERNVLGNVLAHSSQTIGRQNLKTKKIFVKRFYDFLINQSD